MLKQYFVKQGIKESQVEDFIRSSFPLGDYSKTEIQRTPLGIKVVIWTNKPGRIIGRKGEKINEMTEALKERFNIENPQLDVKAIKNPDLDARIVAKQIVSAIERGYNYKKIGNLTIKRIMNAGAVGAEIIVSGKISGSKSMIGKFVEGSIKHCGQPAKELVDVGFEVADTKPGKIGVKVKIMKEFVDIAGEKRTTVKPEAEEKKWLVEEIEEAEEEAGEWGPEAKRKTEQKETRKEPKESKPKKVKKVKKKTEKDKKPEKKNKG